MLLRNHSVNSALLKLSENLVTALLLSVIKVLIRETPSLNIKWLLTENFTITTNFLICLLLAFGYVEYLP